MLRTITATLAAAAAVALAACGSGEPPATSDVPPEAAKTRIERAADVELAPESVPAEAREQGLRAAYSNAATAVEDEQVVGVFVMDDADVAGEVSDMVRSSAPKSARLIVNREVMVVYATTGSDHTTAVERAVEAL
jgi:hypothetical protein